MSSVDLYLTAEYDCPYLPKRQARDLLIDPAFEVDANFYSDLIAQGFRRSGNSVYKPMCLSCSACVPVRINVEQFQRSKSQKRIWSKNRQLEIRVCDLEFNKAHFELFSEYQHWKHQGDVMDHQDEGRYTESMVKSSVSTALVELWDSDVLVAVSVMDNVAQNLSAVYTFFKPSYAARSLGTYMVMRLIELAKTQSYDYVYLGYWIEGSRKMAYKNKFSGLQTYSDKEWRDFAAD